MNKSIDLELGTRLAGNNKQAAKELLLILAKNLPQDIKSIKTFYQKQQYDLLRNSVHKLRGALCYCGTPSLKSAADQLDEALKQYKIDQLENLIATMEQEAQTVLNAITNLK